MFPFCLQATCLVYTPFLNFPRLDKQAKYLLVLLKPLSSSNLQGVKQTAKRRTLKLKKKLCLENTEVQPLIAENPC